MNHCTTVPLAKNHSPVTWLSQPVQSIADTEQNLEGNTGDVCVHFSHAAVFQLRGRISFYQTFFAQIYCIFYYTVINFLTERLWNSSYTQI
jgi:hypothetical protein